jgi:hypothetical protein
MAIDIDRCVMSVWDNANFGALVAGGIWDGEAPVRASFPYAVFSQISQTPGVWTSGGVKNSIRGEITQLLCQLSFYVKEDGTADPKMLLDAIMTPVKAAFDNSLVYHLMNQAAGATGRIILVRRTGENVRREAEGIYRGSLSYRIREKLETVIPGIRA